MKKVLFKNGKDVSHFIEYTDVKSHSINCIVTEVNSWDPDGKSLEETVLFTAYIKWDGCSHFNFGEEQGYLHLCGKSYYDELCKCIQEVWKKAEEYMPTTFKPD